MRDPEIGKIYNIWYNTMIDVDLYVFDDEKSNKSGFKSIKPSYIPLYHINTTFYATREPEIGKNQTYGINTMINVDLYVFDDEKSNKSGFKSIKPSYIPLLPHKCHFLCHARPGN